MAELVDNRRRSLHYSSRPNWSSPVYICVVLITAMVWLLILPLTFWAAIRFVQGGPHFSLSAVVFIYGLVTLIFTFPFAIAYGRSCISPNWILELTERELLWYVSCASRRKLMVRLPFKSMSGAKHLLKQKRSTLIIYRPNGLFLEIPLWALTDDPEPVLNFLKKKKIRVDCLDSISNL